MQNHHNMSYLNAYLLATRFAERPRFAKPVTNFFVGGEREKLPHFTMMLLGVFLTIAGTPFAFISLAWHVRNSALSGIQ